MLRKADLVCQEIYFLECRQTAALVRITGLAINTIGITIPQYLNEITLERRTSLFSYLRYRLFEYIKTMQDTHKPSHQA